MKRGWKLLLIAGSVFVVAMFIFKAYFEGLKKATQKTSRVPASVKRFKRLSKLPTKPILQNKKVNNKPSLPNKPMVVMNNSPKEEWEEDYAENIQQILPGAKVKLYKVKDKIIYKDGKPMAVKSVNVQINHFTRGVSTYKALINPETGRPIRTWGHVQVDSMNPRMNHNDVKLVWKGN
jgi:hypothetical protein